MARPRCAGLAVGGVGDHARGDLRVDAFLGDGGTRGRSSVLPGVMASRPLGRPELYLPSGPILY